MMPKLFLKEHGLDVENDAQPHYVGTQESSIMNVVQGLTKAGATWPPPWEAFVKEKPALAALLEVKWETKSLVNNGLIVRDDVPASPRQTVEKILLALHESEEGRTILGRLELSQFQPATSATYQPMREFLSAFALAFGRPPVPQGEL
jgi:phosphonate transport system substrate-binding protein